jgi:hypothetical protein
MFGLKDTVYPNKNFGWGEIAWETHHCDGYFVWLGTADFMRWVMSFG